MAEKLAPSERHTYIVNGKTIYEWDQTLSEVTLYIRVPEGVRAKQLDIVISSNHLSVGIKGNPPYLNKDLGGLVKSSDCFWTLEDGVLHIQLTKAEEASTWISAIAGHELDLVKQEEDRKRLMLERFQEEHSGFDFSNAEFSGSVPDPRTFLKDINS